MVLLCSSVRRMYVLEVNCCGDKSVNSKKNHPEESRDSICSAGVVHSLPKVPSSTSLPLFMRLLKKKKKKNQYIIYLLTYGRVQENERAG